jgi:hypothetical protein
MALEHGLGMREFAKAFFPVVGAHAGVARATERQIVLEDMPAPIVERHSAGMGFP